MEQPTCSTCPAWVHIDGGDAGDDPGECHGGLPQLVVGTGGLHGPHESAFPPVPGTQFCAQHPAWGAWLSWLAVVAQAKREADEQAG
jgi:hypothetical protein